MAAPREARGLRRSSSRLDVERFKSASHSRSGHLHVLCLDGVYVEAKDGALRFEAAPAPSREELQETLEYVHARVVKWLARRGLLREADASTEAPSYTARQALTLAGMRRVTLETARDKGELADPELALPPPRLTDAAVHERFNRHASDHLAAHDELGRERLCRYLARQAAIVPATALPTSSSARGASAAPSLARPRGASPARLACRRHEVVAQAGRARG